MADQSSNNPPANPSSSPNSSASNLPSSLACDYEEILESLYGNVANYMRALINTSTGDYQSLINCNNLLTNRYSHMNQQLTTLTNHENSYKATLSALQPYFNEIDNVDKQLTQLEQCVNNLDNHAKIIQSKVNRLYK
jgi:DNA repair ATPase RecN